MEIDLTPDEWETVLYALQMCGEKELAAKVVNQMDD